MSDKDIHFQIPREEAKDLATELANVIESTLKPMPLTGELLALINRALAHQGRSS